MRLQPTHTQAEPENKISNNGGEISKTRQQTRPRQPCSTYCSCTLWTDHFAAQRHDITDTRNVCIDANCFIKCSGLVTGIVDNGNLSRLTRQNWFFGERGFGTSAGCFGTQDYQRSVTAITKLVDSADHTARFGNLPQVVSFLNKFHDRLGLHSKPCRNRQTQYQ